MKTPVTAIILTYNESANIADCIRSLDWADEVIVVDSFSTDSTLEAAKSARPDVRIFQNKFEDFGQQRNFAIEKTDSRHDWILFLDADERCTASLSQEIGEAITNAKHVGYYLCCKNFFFGKWLKRCTLYPSWQLRLLKKNEVRFSKEGHGQREITSGSVGYLRSPYDHFGFSGGIHHWIARHNNYSTNEVELIHRLRKESLKPGDVFRGAVERRRALKRFASRTNLLRPWARFGYLYFVRMGFLDGGAGLLFCLLRLSHEIHITVKLHEQQWQSKTANSHEENNGK
jgi:glycosyltransferase involved in cell wall biosynthesis